MTTIGEQLVAARERNGLTVADVARRLRIRSMFVEALEKENWPVVGEPVYVRGFLKNYARLVGLDPAALMSQLDVSEELATPERITYVSEAIQSRAPASNARWFPWLLGSMTTLAAVLVGLVVWNLFAITSAGRIGSAPQTGSVQPSSSQSVPASNSSSPSASGENGRNHQGIDLRLELTQNSWLSVSVDGKRVLYETLPAGTVRQFHGVRAITLRAGNAGGVIASIDGRDIGILGGPGQVEDRIFAVKPPQAENGAHE